MRRITTLILIVLLLLGATGCITIQTPPSAQQPTQPSTQQPTTAPPEIIAFSATPPTITGGGSTTLLWNVTGASSVTIDQGVGNVQSAGTFLVSPAITTTYTLNATNAGGNVTRSVTVTVSAVSPAPSPLPQTPTSYSVINVTTYADPPSFSGTCPKTINFYATITVNGPCTVIYRWERSDRLVSGPYSLTFPAAGSQTVSAEWSGASSSGWAHLHAVTPNEIFSNQASFTLTCATSASAVTSVTAGVTPPSHSGACPKAFNFYGTINVNGPCTVTYKWEGSDGSTTSAESIAFPAAGSATVSTTWLLGASYSGWQRLHVFTPNEAVSSPASFTLNCL